MKKHFVITTFLLFCLQTISFCQNENDILSSAVAKLKTDIANHITEKVYLHFDHPYPYYAAGEVAYFKAYVTVGESHEPSAVSGILHAELIDKNNTVLQSIILQLVNGTASGDFTLADTLQRGIYRIRAYTSRMRNEKEPGYFYQYLSVSSVKNTDRIAEAIKPGTRPGIQFFPEGGNLVADIHSKVAFKAIGTDALGINVSGIVTDNDHKEIARITSAHLGMGEFDFIPEDGKQYKAKLTFADGSQSIVDLPAVEPKGLTLSVNNDNPNKISIEIQANRAYYKENLNKELNLIIYGGGTLRTVKTKLDNAILGLDLPANAFPTGILQVTMLSATGEPLNERIAFIRNNDLLNLSIATGKPLFAKHENVPLSLSVKNKDGNPVTGSFSVSVIDESKILVDENSENSILSYLLLTSDLRGYIEKPNYYFANNTPENRADLDILMLTQGYRKFVWKKLLNDSVSVAKAFKPEKAINISGVLKTKAGLPIAGCGITLIPENGGNTLLQQTDSLGKFSFTNMVFETGTRFILKTQSSAARNSVLILDNPLPGPVVSVPDTIYARYNANADLLLSLQNNASPGNVTAGNGKYMQLAKESKALTIVKNASYRSSNLGGPGHADQVIMGDEFKNAPTLSTGLNGLAHGVQFNAGVPALLTGMVVSGGSEILEPMLVVVDGAVMGSGINIDLYSPGSVETVEILKSANAVIYGVSGGAGAMVITTRQGGEREAVLSQEMSPGIFSIKPVGFYKAREFYSPQLNPGHAANNLPFQHPTIFWKPDFNTDVNGNASINFLNGEGTGTYRVEIEGFDTKGNLGHAVYRYKVE